MKIDPIGLLQCFLDWLKMLKLETISGTDMLKLETIQNLKDIMIKKLKGRKLRELTPVKSRASDAWQTPSHFVSSVAPDRVRKRHVRLATANMAGAPRKTVLKF